VKDKAKKEDENKANCDQDWPTVVVYHRQHQIDAVVDLMLVLSEQPDFSKLD
jgi:hypothetical protein